jgi:hypothetical protein
MNVSIPARYQYREFAGFYNSLVLIVENKHAQDRYHTGQHATESEPVKLPFFNRPDDLVRRNVCHNLAASIALHGILRLLEFHDGLIY